MFPKNQLKLDLINDPYVDTTVISRSGCPAKGRTTRPPLPFINLPFIPLLEKEGNSPSSF
jgi:hypothetical protein